MGGGRGRGPLPLPIASGAAPTAARASAERVDGRRARDPQYHAPAVPGRHWATAGRGTHARWLWIGSMLLSQAEVGRGFRRIVRWQQTLRTAPAARAKVPGRWWWLLTPGVAQTDGQRPAAQSGVTRRWGGQEAEVSGHNTSACGTHRTGVHRCVTLHSSTVHGERHEKRETAVKRGAHERDSMKRVLLGR